MVCYDVLSHAVIVFVLSPGNLAIHVISVTHINMHRGQCKDLRLLHLYVLSCCLLWRVIVILSQLFYLKTVMRRDPNCFARSQTIRRRLGSVTLTGQGLGLGLGASLFPVGAMEIKAGISAHNGFIVFLLSPGNF